MPRYSHVSLRFSQPFVLKYLEVLLLNNIFEVEFLILQCCDPIVVLAQHALHGLCVDQGEKDRTEFIIFAFRHDGGRTDRSLGSPRGASLVARLRHGR